MTEDEAQAWIGSRFDEAACERVARFVALVLSENTRQNLIAPATTPSIWVRHVVDSAQLIALARSAWSSWLDIGTGGGFPGMVVALLCPRAITMVEPRRKRAEFLEHCCDVLMLRHARVVHGRVEHLAGPYDVISARAVASVEKILHAGLGCAKADTQWLLPRGRLGDDGERYLGQLGSTMFHVEQSITDPSSSILVLRGDGR